VFLRPHIHTTWAPPLRCWLVAFLYALKAGRMVRFAQTDVDVVLARPHAPGRLGTSQLSNPNTQWAAPSVGIAQPRSHRSIDIVEIFHESPSCYSDAAAACCLGDAVHD